MFSIEVLALPQVCPPCEDCGGDIKGTEQQQAVKRKRRLADHHAEVFHVVFPLANPFGFCSCECLWVSATRAGTER